MSQLKDRLQAALKESMKSRNELRTGTLRMVLADIKKRDIDAEIAGKPVQDDAAVMGLLLTLVKQRRESIATYTQAGRNELAAKEQSEIVIIEEFLPKQLDTEAAKAKIQAIIATTGAQGPKDMGKVMAEVKTQLAGQVDMTQVSGWVKGMLG
jgi:uncharacterized protein